MKAIESKSTRIKYVPLAVIGTAAALASTGSSAGIISVTELNQDVANGTLLSDIGGMDGVNIDYSSPGMAKLGSSTGGYTLPLFAGTAIGPGSTFFTETDSEGILTDGNLYLKSGLFGVEFDAGSGAQYGWLDLIINDNVPSAIVILNGWGYETDVGVSIEAGETATSVNEPTGLALLAAGAIGLVASRRRKVKPVISA